MNLSSSAVKKGTKTVFNLANVSAVSNKKCSIFYLWQHTPHAFSNGITCVSLKQSVLLTKFFFCFTYLDFESSIILGKSCNQVMLGWIQYRQLRWNIFFSSAKLSTWKQMNKTLFHG